MSTSSEAIHNIFKDALTYGVPRKYSRVSYQPDPYDPQKLVKFPIGVWKPLRASYDDFVTKAIETLPSKGFIDQTLVQLSGTKKRAYIDNLSHTGYTIKDEPMSSYSPYHKMPQANAKNVQQRVEEDNEYYSLTHKSWQKSYKDTDGKVNSWVGAADDAYTQQILKEYKLSNGLIASDAPKTLFTTDDRFFSEVDTNKKIKSKLENLQITIEELKRKNNISPGRFGQDVAVSKTAFDVSKKMLDDQLELYETSQNKKTKDETTYLDAISDYNRLQKELEKSKSNLLPINVAMSALSDNGVTKIVSDISKQKDIEAIIAKQRGAQTSKLKPIFDYIPIEYEDKLKEYVDKEVEAEIKTITIDPDADKARYDAEVARIEADAETNARAQVERDYKNNDILIQNIARGIRYFFNDRIKTDSDIATESANKHKEFSDAYASYKTQSENLKNHPELIKRYQIEHQEAYNKLKSSEIDAKFYVQLTDEQKRITQAATRKALAAAAATASKEVQEKKEIFAKEQAEIKRTAAEEQRQNKRYGDLLNSTLAPFSAGISKSMLSSDAKREIESELITKAIQQLLVTTRNVGGNTTLAIDDMKRDITEALQNANLPSASAILSSPGSNFPSGSAASPSSFPYISPRRRNPVKQTKQSQDVKASRVLKTPPSPPKTVQPKQGSTTTLSRTRKIAGQSMNDPASLGAQERSARDQGPGHVTRRSSISQVPTSARAADFQRRLSLTIMPSQKA